eukprot:CAMPEP_0178846072 /NCGR_PEP_ID=MMETSP0746-20121128/17815_1 /TAXON_ID=913974 /ORGANISM="Nitzschia punctata, Strain CCMP561" /LENGTH=869 /DNA_ID=CAMNT_0020510389 /DNA_START=58 /DNA_END=2667 /DNA_ORIENTATION=+
MNALLYIVLLVLVACTGRAVTANDAVDADGTSTATGTQSSSGMRGMQSPENDGRQSVRIPLPRQERVPRQWSGQQQRQQSCSTCSEDSAVSFAGNPRDDIFNQLTGSEYESLIAFSVNDAGLADFPINSLANWEQALNANYIAFIQLFPPPKLEAIAYLDGFTDTPPARYGIVTVHRGAATPRDVMQYKVGPLVNGRVDTANAVVETMLNDNELPWSRRGNYYSAERFYFDKINSDAAKLKDLLRATTGYCYGTSDCGFTDNIYIHTAGNIATTDDKRVTTVMFFLSPSGKDYGSPFLMPIPLRFDMIEDPDQDPRFWETTNFEYCYQGPYNSADELMAAYNQPGFVLCDVPSNNLDWTLTDTVTPVRADSTIKEPFSYDPSGKRYSIQSATSRRKLQETEMGDQETDYDLSKWHISNYFMRNPSGLASPPKNEKSEKGNTNRNLQFDGADGTGHKVSWLGWSFHVASDYMHGLVIRDLSFKGERLAYELSFQEYFASYSAAGSSAHVFYFDSNWEIGRYSKLKAGVDCPADATFLPLIQYNGISAEVSSNLLCIFEQPYGESMWRHGFGRRVEGIPRTALQIRVVSTMGNYDYIPTMSLMADGVMEMKLEAAGYLQGGYSIKDDLGVPNPEIPPFGARVRDNVVGLLHDHVIGVKADLDVGGLENTLVVGSIEYGTYEEALGTPATWRAQDGAKYMNWTQIETETGVSAKDHSTILVTSPNKNSWGSNKSYELVFESTIPRQVYPQNHPIGSNVAWQYSNVAITRQKDEERYCSFPSNFNIGTRGIPSFDLNYFQQGDDKVVEEDLVFWIMFGVQHYPKAEDIPLVSNFGSGFILKPRNMYDRAAFEDLSDNYGSKPPACVAPSVVDS